MNIHDLYTPFLLFIQQISHEVSGGDPLSKGLISMGIVSALVVMARSLPKKVFGFLKSRMIVSMRVESRTEDPRSQYLYDHVMEKFFNKLKGRSYLLRLRKTWDVDEIISMESDYGFSWFMLDGKLFWVNRDKNSNKTAGHEESIVIYTFGKSSKVFDIFSNDYIRPRVQKYYSWDYGCGWSYVMPISGVSVLFLDPDLKKALDEKIDFFLHNESWYNERNIPWKLSITLHGEPGTGKTSIIRYVADRLNYSVGLVDIAQIPKGAFFGVIREASNMKIVTGIEDFDISDAGKKRHIPKAGPMAISDTAGVYKTDDTEEEPKRAVKGADLMDLLNTFQGSIPLNGAVTVLTTNHISKIDPALLRKGRMDLVIEVGRLKIEQTRKFFSYHYPGETLDPSLMTDSSFRACDLHGLFLDHPESANLFVTGLKELYHRQSAKVIPINQEPGYSNG